jgi:hypothetical protein
LLSNIVIILDIKLDTDTVFLFDDKVKVCINEIVNYYYCIIGKVAGWQTENILWMVIKILKPKNKIQNPKNKIQKPKNKIQKKFKISKSKF